MAKLRQVARNRNSSGYVLVDALAALAITVAALVAILGGIAHATRVAAQLRENTLHVVELENGRTTADGLLFTVR